ALQDCCDGPKMLRTHVRSALAAPHSFQRLARLRVEAVADAAGLVLRVLDGFEVAEEGPRRQLLHLLPRRAPNGQVRRDEDDVMAIAVLGREALEERVRVLVEADLERPVGLVRAGPVE